MHRKGGKTVVKPIALGERQRTRFAIQWIMKASDSKSGRTVEERLAKEILAVLNGKSGALDKKEEMHKFAMVNRYVEMNCLDARIMMPINLSFAQG